MADWQQAGRTADAHRIRDRFRKAFDQTPKTIARHRVVDVLRATGKTRCLDLWGGGLSANELVTAGFDVISVEDGSLDVLDGAYRVSGARKRRALETAAKEGGYEARWGKAAKYAAEADVAFLDFCGPWSVDVRKTVEACRHMDAVVITLVSDHDINTTATTQVERIAAYQTFLKIAYGGPKRSDYQPVPCRLLARYKRPTGQPVFLLLLAKHRLPIRHLSFTDRLRLDPAKKMAANQRQATKHRERRANDPAFRAAQYARNKTYKERKLAEDPIAYRAYMNRKAREAHHRRKLNKVLIPSPLG